MSSIVGHWTWCDVMHHPEVLSVMLLITKCKRRQCCDSLQTGSVIFYWTGWHHSTWLLYFYKQDTQRQHCFFLTQPVRTAHKWTQELHRQPDGRVLVLPDKKLVQAQGEQVALCATLTRSVPCLVHIYYVEHHNSWNVISLDKAPPATLDKSKCVFQHHPCRTLLRLIQYMVAGEPFHWPLPEGISRVSDDVDRDFNSIIVDGFL